MVSTTAIRSPARIAGIASGSSTRRNDCREDSPIARAASRTSGGAARSPSSVFRNRTSSVYETSATSTVVMLRPVTGTSSWNSARLGIV